MRFGRHIFFVPPRNQQKQTLPCSISANVFFFHLDDLRSRNLQPANGVRRHGLDDILNALLVAATRWSQRLIWIFMRIFSGRVAIASPKTIKINPKQNQRKNNFFFRFFRKTTRKMVHPSPQSGETAFFRGDGRQYRFNLFLFLADLPRANPPRGRPCPVSNRINFLRTIAKLLG